MSYVQSFKKSKKLTVVAEQKKKDPTTNCISRLLLQDHSVVPPNYPKVTTQLKLYEKSAAPLSPTISLFHSLFILSLCSKKVAR